MARRPRPRDPVIRVGDRVITLGQYLKNLRLHLVLERGLPAQERGSVLPMRLVETLTEDALVRVEAERRGWKVDPAAVSREIRSHFLPTARPASAPNTDGSSGDDVAEPGQNSADIGDQPVAEVEAEFRRLYRLMREVTGLSDADYRAIAEDNLLTDRLEAQVVADVPARAEQVHLRIIRVSSHDAADDVTRRLMDGVDFAYVARRLSEDSSRDIGGDIGWLPACLHGPEFDDLAFSLDAGSWGGPVIEGRTYVFIQCLERDPDRPIPEETQAALREDALSAFLARLRRRTEVSWFWDSLKYEWAMDRVQDLLAASAEG